MKTLIIITGANKGLGNAIFHELIKYKKYHVLSISRKLSKAQEILLDKKSPFFTYLKCDFSSIRNTVKIRALNRFKDRFDNVVFISNAGVIEPIGAPGSLNEKELVSSIHVNVVAPVLVANYILKIFSNKPITIVNISSGAANRPIAGWATYCASKAFMAMFYSVTKENYRKTKTAKVFSLDPGLIDTEMQKKIRTADEKSFPSHQSFVALKLSKRLAKPTEVARRILTQIGIK